MAHLDDWRTTVLFLLHSNQQAVTLSDLLLKMFDLRHNFVCCQMQLKPPWQEGHYMFDEMYMTHDDG
jgi:hypothetical protein